MAEIRPFRGVHYNQSLIKDLSAVICPPYDIIAPQLHKELYSRNDYNFVRLEFARELPADTAAENKYTRSAAILEQWLGDGILQISDAPAIYLHDHYFKHHGKEYRRRGIVVCVRLEEWEEMVVRPHEGILSEPRDDRLNLLWALKANTSSILALFEDQGRRIAPLMVAKEKSKPLISFKGADSECHKVWAITEPGTINQVSASLTEQSLYIADGHHRYSSALTYQRERRSYSSGWSDNEAFDFVMMTLVDFVDPGLIIRAPHRLVSGISRMLMDGLMAKLEVFFEVEKLPLSSRGVWQRVDELVADTNDVRLVFFGLSSEHLLALRLRDLAAASEIMPYFHSEIYKRLDVSIVDHLIIEKLLEVCVGDEGKITYSYDRHEAVNKVLAREHQLAFILKPVKPDLIKNIADDGDKMPRKSTYFYPKIPAGLVFNRLV